MRHHEAGVTVVQCFREKKKNKAENKLGMHVNLWRTVRCTSAEMRSGFYTPKDCDDVMTQFTCELTLCFSSFMLALPLKQSFYSKKLTCFLFLTGEQQHCLKFPELRSYFCKAAEKV